MRLSSTLLLALSSLVSAGFWESCKSPSLATDGHTFTASCANDAGTFVSSTIDLDTCLTNTLGVLQWEVNGNYGASCTGCAVPSTSPILSCSCYNLQGVATPAAINLDEDLQNYNGVLACTIS